MDKWRYLAIGVCLATASGVASADSLDAQRQRYQQVKQAWDSNQMATVEQLLPTLRNYPLYPYLEYRQLTQDLSQISPAQISDFLSRNPTLPPARSLSSRFVNELARREDWRGLLSFSPQAPKPVAARCNYYYAKWATGEQQVAWDGASDIWLNGQSLPGSCDKLFTVWQQAGHQTPLATLARMRLALKESNASLVSFLLKQLPDDYQTMGTALAKLQSDPTSVESFARTVGPTDFTRSATTIAFTRLARQDVENARAMIPILARLQKMSDKEKLELEEAVAWRLMGNDATDQQAKWRDEVTLRSHSSLLLERRIRMALGSGDRKSLQAWLARLPSDAKDKDEWRYWRATLLIDQGNKTEGEAMLRELTNARGFYPMVAAQKLNIPYPIMVEVATKPDASLAKLPEIARVRELMYWNMDNLARNEWSYLVASRSKPEQEALARYAFEQKWADLSVQATIVAKLWDHLEERFPLAWPQEFRRATEGKGITPSYAMAIARQESAWNPKAQSPVGAAGLMQVMPRTADHTVKLNNISGYVNSSQLLDPVTNIAIGTSYLEEVYQQFGRNRILASAAYNAGPSRVNTWLGNSGGQVDAVAFIESIPFSETRGYVKNVLAYDAFYRHFMNRPAKVLSDAELQRRY
ncbi:murein transglycosylase [Yersinia ruckeri]|uniref:peptidoglycan lytic exotransglycosylase n=1 Tax=Yersinia ruckeri TaxID=29486 RepID=A0A0A5FRU4_YERRU|nr:murein transglycosylase [Yersinia ruckeri]AUQ41007.1 murein transglycosylase [Yersinia ruckeri]EEP98636.1 Soluble lytic murein transglycosylase [Yersinia ruckeri ATCC 29473]EKN3346762.1 murein transglycosylase [Yersinia ruckeri]EKN4183183.1 murein transglycosylase [Yersinia ruckeri]EKN4197288.1 murein transglycosylase [Yersinia ruckeri]